MAYPAGVVTGPAGPKATGPRVMLCFTKGPETTQPPPCSGAMGIVMPKAVMLIVPETISVNVCFRFKSTVRCAHELCFRRIVIE